MKDVDLNDLRAFVRVVDRGGFAPAARELGVPTSTVSRALTRLEARAGVRLLHRTSRSVHPTPEGKALHTSIQEAVTAVERAALALEPGTDRIAGLLRVSAPPDLAATFLADVAVAFTERHPLVRLDLVLTNRAVSLVSERVDVALRAANRLSDSSVHAKPLGLLEHALYASPRYVERHGAPASIDSLGEHRLIVFRADELRRTWRLHEGAREVALEVRGHMGGDDFAYVRNAALAGGGIALLPRLLCVKDEAAGRLVRVLPAVTAKGATLYVLYPSARHVPARVTAFRDFVAAAFEATRTARPRPLG